jgi:RNA polymerase sigma factor (sigma-70 family)
MEHNDSPGSAEAAASPTRLWQLLLVVLSLGTFAVVVLLPLSLLVLFLTGFVGLLWTSEQLARLGALEASAFGGAVYLGGGLLLGGLLLALLVTGWNLLRRLADASHAPPFLLRWPWFLFGALLLLMRMLVLPPGRSALPGVSGAWVIAMASWCFLTVGLCWERLSSGGLSLAWRGARASPFIAGLVTAGGLGSAVFLLTLGAVQEDSLSSNARALRVPRPTCSDSDLECTRQLFLELARRQGSSPWRQSSALPSSALASASGDFPLAAEEAFEDRGAPAESAPSSSFHRCMETSYQRRDMMERARRIAERSVGTADAWDIVHATLLSVCLQGMDRYDFEQFFLRSIQNGVVSWHRKQGAVRSCPLELLPEPVCLTRPDDEYVRSETQNAVRKAFCVLSPNERQLLELKYFDELGDLEIAQRLHISHVAARKRLQRAREKLLREIVQQCQ